MFLLPRSYSLSPAKHLMREIICCKSKLLIKQPRIEIYNFNNISVIQPTVDRLTDPDFINQKILDYIEQQRITAAMHKRTFEYANSYEDFLKMIQDSEDIEMLKNIR